MAKKILIVEDDTFLQDILTTKMSKEDYQVTIASSIPDALKALESKPDAILLDLLLPPVGDGFEVLQAVRNNPETKELPVVIFSNLSDEKNILKARELHASDFIIKSTMSLPDIIQKIKDLVDHKTPAIPA